MSDSTYSERETGGLCELLPCPFCGGRPTTQAMSDYLCVTCLDCGASPDRRAYKEHVEAVASWNRRPAAQAAELERLRGALENIANGGTYFAAGDMRDEAARALKTEGTSA